MKEKNFPLQALINHDNLIKQMPGFFGILNLHSQFLFVNNAGAEWTGFDSAEAMQGLSYADVRCRAAEDAELFIQHDQFVLAGNHLKFLGYYCYSNNDWKIILGEKYPVKENNKVVGLISQFNDFTHSNLIDIGRFLINLDEKYYPKKSQKQFFYTLGTEYSNIRLSKQQSECLFYLLRGKTAKNIAEILNLSKRTVEAYIETIKFKFACSTKYELIEKCISMGYFNMIPESLFSLRLKN